MLKQHPNVWKELAQRIRWLRNNRQTRPQATLQLCELLKVLAHAGTQGPHIIPLLQQTLRDRAPTVRAASANTLAALARVAKPAHQALLDRLKDPSEHVKMAVIQALGAIKQSDSIPKLEAIAQKGNRRLSEAAMRALSQMKGRAASVFRSLLQSKVVWRRHLALKGMILTGPALRSLQPQALALWRTATPQTKHLLLKVIAKLQHPTQQTERLLLQALQDKQLSQREVIQVLAVLPPRAPGLQTALLASYKQAGVPLRRLILKVLWRLGAKAWRTKALLLQASHSTDQVLQLYAFKALGHIGPKAFPLLDRAVKDGPSRRRYLALYQLKKLQKAHKKLVPSLIAIKRSLRDKTAGVRDAALHFVPRLPLSARKKLLGTLLLLLRDQNYGVLTTLTEVLKGLGKGILPALLKTLDAPSVRQRYGALYAIQQLGKKALPATPALLKKLSSQDPKLRKGILLVLTKQTYRTQPKGWNQSLIKCLYNPPKESQNLAAKLLLRWPIRGLKQKHKKRLAVIIARDLWRAHSLRKAAFLVLAKLGKAARAVAHIVVRSLEDPDPAIRAQAASVLGQSGPHTYAIKRALERAADDPDPVVRQEAWRALGH